MKQSDVIWLGAVPNHWPIGRFKHAGRFQTGMDHKHLSSGSVPVYGSSEIPFGYVDTTMASGPAIAIGRKGTIDKPFMLYGDFWAVDTCMFNRISSSSYEVGYCFYVSTIVPWLDYSTKTALPSLTQTQVDNIPMPRPSIEEQRRITHHLDRATTRIDALVAKKTHFIELLREKRQAMITHAVTKGLDRNAAMKDSGVEWLGEVPETWDTAPLKSFLQLRRDIVGTDSANTRLLSLTLQGVIERDLENPTGKMPASFDGYQRISAGEMVFCLFDMDETPRTVGVAPQDGMITGAYTVFRPQSELWARYLYYFFLHVDEYKRLKPFYKGLRKTIRSGPFLSIQVPRPKESEAKAIVDHLDRATARIDTLIAKTERSIELLREHRTALITAAVTGKIDLRPAP